MSSIKGLTVIGVRIWSRVAICWRKNEPLFPIRRNRKLKLRRHGYLCFGPILVEW